MATAYAAGLTKSSGYDPAIKLAYYTGAQEALRCQWRPLTPDDAPPLYEDILIRSEQGDVMVAQMVETQVHGTSLRQLTWLPAVKCKVVAWMPIPEYKTKVEN